MDFLNDWDASTHKQYQPPALLWHRFQKDDQTQSRFRHNFYLDTMYYWRDEPGGMKGVQNTLQES